MFDKKLVTEISLFDSFYQNTINSDNLKSDINSFLLLDENNLMLLRYAGYAFSDTDFAFQYYEKVTAQYKTTYLPLPRGNLSKFNSYIFVGIKPGSYKTDFNICGTAWLFGPSSEVLNKFLIELKIYPYFTNVYKSYFDEENKNIDNIVIEIECIRDLYEKYNDDVELQIVTMGKYPEYDLLKEKFKNLKFKNIWHPSYILKNNSSNFYDWIYQWKLKN